MIVANVRTTPITPKATGMAIASAEFDGRMDSLTGSILCPRPVQDTNIDDEFVNMPRRIDQWWQRRIILSTGFGDQVLEEQNSRARRTSCQLLIWKNNENRLNRRPKGCWSRWIFASWSRQELSATGSACAAAGEAGHDRYAASVAADDAKPQGGHLNLIKQMFCCAVEGHNSFETLATHVCQII